MNITSAFMYQIVVMGCMFLGVCMHVCIQVTCVFVHACIVKELQYLMVCCSQYRRHGVGRSEVLPTLLAMADTHQVLPRTHIRSHRLKHTVTCQNIRRQKVQTDVCAGPRG